MRRYLLHIYFLSDVSDVSVHICVQQITHLVDSAQSPPLMQIREED